MTSKWPTTCKMPELNAKGDAFLTNAIHRVFRRTGPRDLLSGALVGNFIRMADGLVSQYYAARTDLQQFVAQPEAIGAYEHAINHIEMAITTMDRALRFGRALRDSSTVGAYIGTPSVLKHQVSKIVRRMRNAIQHWDEEVAKQPWTQGDAQCLLLWDDHMELQTDKLRYAEFSSWVDEVSQIAESLAHFTPVATV